MIVYKKVALWSIVAVTLAGCAWVGFRYFQKQWFYNHPLSDPKWSFQFYKPQKLPSNIRITASRINVSEEANTVYSVIAEQNLRTEDWVYAIREYRSNGSQYKSKLRNLDITSVKPTCTQRITSTKQSYRLCHWLDYGRISVYEVKFTKQNTVIDSQLPTKKGQLIPMSELDQYVDSFKEAEPPKQVVRGI